MHLYTYTHTYEFVEFIYRISVGREAAHAGVLLAIRSFACSIVQGQ